MKWLNSVIGWILKEIGVNTQGKVGGSIQFFLYDIIKISVLLVTLIFIITYVKTYFPPERTKRILMKYNGLSGNLLAALLGTVTPFCSCSSIPIFIGFTNAGLPIGMTLSFLISSPMVDLGSLVLLTSIFGWKIAVAYVIVGLVLAVAGGTVIEKLHFEKHLAPQIFGKAEKLDNTVYENRKQRLRFSLSESWETLKYVFKFMVVGVAVGALIHNVIPTAFIQKILGSENAFSVILASVAGIPLYADIFGTIPIAEALYFKGVGLGTVLSFMMGVTALSFPSIIMLKKVMKPKLLAVFVGIVALGIIVVGYFFNVLEFLF